MSCYTISGVADQTGVKATFEGVADFGQPADIPRRSP
jgi:hypothetical protein